MQLFKCLTISEEEKGKYTIVALQHEPQKEAIVDNGAVFEPRETTLATSGLRKVDNLQVQANGEGIELSFDAIVQNSAMVKYQIKLYRDGKFYKLYDNLTSPKITFVDLPDGEYIAEVRAKNAQGQLSDPVTKAFTVRLTVSELVTVPKMFAIELNWRNPIFANPKTAIEIWVSQDNQFANARKLVSLAYPTTSYTYSGLTLNDRFWFWVRMVDGDNAGRFTEAVEGRPSQDATALTDYLHGQITKSELGQSLIDSLQADIDDAVAAEAGLRQSAVANAVAQIIAESQARTKAIQDEAKARTTALNTEITNRTKAIQAESAKLTAKIQAEANARGTAISQLQNVDVQQAQKITALTAKAEQALSGLEAEKVARAKGDEAEARQRTALTSRVASAESGLTNLQRTISTQAQSLSEVSQNLNARFDNLQIGGRNLLFDTGNLSKYRQFHTRGQITEQSEYVHLEVNESGNGGIYNSVKSTHSLKQGQNAVLSFDYRTNMPNLNYTYVLSDVGGNWAIRPIITVINDNEWHKAIIAFTAPRELTNIRALIGGYHVATGTYLDVKNVKLELGTIATDWTPAPEDLESAVEVVSAELTSYKSTQATKEQTTAQQISGLTARMATTESGIFRVEKAVSDNRLSTATQLNQLTANLNKANSQIVEEKSARVSGDKANSDKITALTSRVSNAEAGITNIQSTKANKTEVASLARTTLQSEWRNDVKTEVDNIKVGGRNLLFDTGNLSKYRQFHTRGQITEQSEYVHLEVDESGNSGIYNSTKSTHSLKQGENAVLSFDYRTNMPNLNYTYVLSDVGGNWVVRPTISIINDGEWHSATVAFVAPKELTNIRALVGGSNVAVGSYLDIKNVKLEKGTIATDWTPAPEDVESAVEAVSAKVDSARETLTQADQALGQRIDTVSASVNDAKAQISTVSRAVATTDGKLSATHTIKTQTIAGGRKAIAGIALGASGDNRTAESSVIVMADKLGVVKNASDGNVVPMLTVVNNRVAVNGNLIADGTILGKHIRANQTLTAPVINGGNISGTNITGTTITGATVKGGEVTGATVSGGIVKGSRIEGGVISGSTILGDIVKAVILTRNGNDFEGTVPASEVSSRTVVIPSFSFKAIPGETSTVAIYIDGKKVSEASISGTHKQISARGVIPRTTVQGTVSVSVSGQVSGDVSGNVGGNVSGNVGGYANGGYVSGSASGYVSGTARGRASGNVSGSATGTATGEIPASFVETSFWLDIPAFGSISGYKQITNKSVVVKVTANNANAIDGQTTLVALVA